MDDFQKYIMTITTVPPIIEYHLYTESEGSEQEVIDFYKEDYQRSGYEVEYKMTSNDIKANIEAKFVYLPKESDNV